LEALVKLLQRHELTLYPNRAAADAMAAPYIDELLHRCQLSEGVILVAVDGQQIVGFTCVLARVSSEDLIELDPEHAYITDLVVLPDQRRRGVGRALLEAAEAHARRGGAARLRVGVLAANETARRLYGQLGYSEQELVLEKALGRLPP
jgi:ribosomal protein S18 acetylase RimI-like enzyme